MNSPRHLFPSLLLSLALLLPLLLHPALATGPLEPPQALAAFSLEPGLTLEAVATEPLVVSPSALAWDENARLFVAENPGYPTGPAPGQPPQGRIVELIDTNHDGRADRRVVFADGLDFPNGLMPWRGGWLVTDAPHLLWLADTNHDGRADLREVWFTGFATNQTTQLRACYPTLAPDGWIYLARGLSAGSVHSPRWPSLPTVNLDHGDFRFRPDGSAAETIGGNCQFGLVIDDLNRRFLVSNRNPLMHAVVHPRFWRRHPELPFSAIVHDVSPSGYEARVHPRSPDTTTAGFMPELLAAPHAGSFTAACGIHQFYGDALGPNYDAHWFICEPAQNLVQRQIATPVGPTFSSQNPTPGRDFLTSTDGWFRPVFASTGPDGALYLVDMYRKIIDHPAYLPESIRDQLDYNAGKDRGRIWRIRRSHPPLPPSRRLDPHAPLALAEALGDRNLWTRQTAFRLLLDHAANTNLWNVLISPLEASAPPREAFQNWSNLTRQATDPASGPHLGHARRMWLLHHFLLATPRTSPALQALANRASHHLLLTAFHPSPSLRETTWRILQSHPFDPKHALPDVPYDMVRFWAEDPNPAVRFHVALQCGTQDDWPPVLPALASIARTDASNRWSRAAVLSGLKGRETAFLEELLATPPPDTPAFAELLHEFGALAGAANLSPLWLAPILAPSADDSVWQLAALRGYAEGLRSQGAPPLLATLSQISLRNPRAHDLLSRIHSIGQHSLDAANQPSAPLSRRIAALHFLAELDFATVQNSLRLALAPDQPLEIQIAAARTLARFDHPEVGRIFTDPARWNLLPPAVRDLALAALVSRPQFIPPLLDALENGHLPLWSIDPQRRRQLQNQGPNPLRERARKLFANAGGSDRRQVFEALKPILAQPASGARGHPVFARTCANCHTLAGEGTPVGPDLSGLRNQPPEALLFHIIVPDAEIYPGFHACEIETRDGRTLSGIALRETPDEIVLRQAGGEQETIRRSNLVSFTRSRVSLMPQELENTMSRQELADLIAFLRAQP